MSGFDEITFAQKAKDAGANAFFQRVKAWFF